MANSLVIVSRSIFFPLLSGFYIVICTTSTMLDKTMFNLFQLSFIPSFTVNVETMINLIHLDMIHTSSTQMFQLGIVMVMIAEFLLVGYPSGFPWFYLVLNIMLMLLR